MSEKQSKREKKEKKNGAMQTVLIAKLMKDGFIVRCADGSYDFDMSPRLDDTYADAGQAAIDNLRLVMRRAFHGFKKMGVEVRMKTLIHMKSKE